MSDRSSRGSASRFVYYLNIIIQTLMPAPPRTPAALPAACTSCTSCAGRVRCRAPRHVHKPHAPHAPPRTPAGPASPAARLAEQARVPPCLSAPCRALLSPPSCAACQRHATAPSKFSIKFYQRVEKKELQAINCYPIKLLNQYLGYKKDSSNIQKLNMKVYELNRG